MKWSIINIIKKATFFKTSLSSQKIIIQKTDNSIDNFNNNNFLNKDFKIYFSYLIFYFVLDFINWYFNKL